MSIEEGTVVTQLKRENINHSCGALIGVFCKCILFLSLTFKYSSVLESSWHFMKISAKGNKNCTRALLHCKRYLHAVVSPALMQYPDPWHTFCILTHLSLCKISNDSKYEMSNFVCLQN